VQAQAEHILVHDMCAGPKPRPASGFYGVCATGKRWMAQINYDGKQHRLGTFDTKHEAAFAQSRRQHSRTTGKQGSVARISC
jgi:hypothetical protein